MTSVGESAEVASELVRVLLVEDVASDARLAEMALTESRLGTFEVTHVATAAAMERELDQHSFDALLLDLSLPDATGLMGFEKARRLAPTLPIVVLTSHDDEQAALQATRCGAQDYLIKGSGSAWRLARALRHAIERQRIVRELEEARNREHHQATHDALTGLSNRAAFHELVRREIARASRNGSSFALLFVDLDRFKQVNDEVGHEGGDQLLREVGARLLGCLRASDAAARLGGDEFLVLVNELADGDTAVPIARRVLEELGRPIDLSGRSVSIGASVGIAGFPEDGRTVEGLMRRADAAMYVAKSDGGGQMRYYTAVQHAEAERRFALQRDLRAAVRDRQLLLEYRPRREIASRRIVAFEAVLLWPRAGGEPLPSGAFLDEADRAGLLRPIGEWTLEGAAAQLRRWRHALAPSLRLCVDVSSQELRSPQFHELVAACLARTGVAHDAIELAIAQPTFAGALQERPAALEELARAGLRLWLDEVAPGSAALALAGSGLLAGLRIDADLVRGVDDDPARRAAVAAIVACAARHGLEVAAAGVESAEQGQALATLGCSFAAGPGFGRPTRAERVGELFASP